MTPAEVDALAAAVARFVARCEWNGDCLDGRPGMSERCKCDHLPLAEPTGLGAVVTDAEGREWVHFGNGCWIKSVPNAQMEHREWSQLTAARVLSEGMAPIQPFPQIIRVRFCCLHDAGFTHDCSVMGCWPERDAEGAGSA